AEQAKPCRARSPSASGSASEGQARLQRHWVDDVRHAALSGSGQTAPLHTASIVGAAGHSARVSPYPARESGVVQLLNRNLVLSEFGPDLELIRGELVRTRLHAGQVLNEPEEEIRNVYFLAEGVVSKLGV